MRIDEIATPILYHIVKTSDAVTMFDTAKLAPSTNAAEIEHSKGKNFFLSTARMPRNRYSQGKGAGNTIFVLDGSKLGNKYKVTAMDYWGHDFRKMDKGSYEAEDRLLSDSPTIPNFNQYIKEVHICVKPGKITDANVKKLIQKSRRAGIPVFVYDNEKSFTLLSKANRKSPMEMGFGSSEKSKNYKYDGGKEVLKYIVELLTKTDRKTLSPGASEYIDKRAWHSDMASGISATIHNSKSNKNSTAYDDTGQIIQLMKKLGLPNYNALAEYLILMWYPRKIQYSDPADILIAAKDDPNILKSIPPKFLMDPKFCLKLAITNPDTLSYLPAYIQTEKFLLSVLKGNADAWAKMPRKLRYDNKNFISAAINANSELIKWMWPDEIGEENYERMCREGVVKNPSEISYLIRREGNDITKRLAQDPQFWAEAVSKNVDVYNFLPREMEDNIEVCRAAMKADPDAMRHVIPREILYQIEDENENN